MPLKIYNVQSPFTVLLEIYPPSVEYREKLVQRAIEARKEVSKDASQHLKHILDKAGLQIPGFRSSFDAPTSKLLHHITDTAWQFLDITLALLHIWYELEGELAKELSHYLKKAEFEINPLFFSSGKENQFQKACSQVALSQFLDDFAEKHPQFDKDALPLMFSCLTGIAPLTQEMITVLEEAMISHQAPVIEELLNTIQGWDVQSLYVEKLPLFIENLQFFDKKW